MHAAVLAENIDKKNLFLPKYSSPMYNIINEYQILEIISFYSTEVIHK